MIFKILLLVAYYKFFFSLRFPLIKYFYYVRIEDDKNAVLLQRTETFFCSQSAPDVVTVWGV